MAEPNRALSVLLRAQEARGASDLTRSPALTAGSRSPWRGTRRQQLMGHVPGLDRGRIVRFLSHQNTRQRPGWQSRPGRAGQWTQQRDCMSADDSELADNGGRAITEPAVEPEASECVA